MTSDMRDLIRRLGLPHELPRAISHTEVLEPADLANGLDSGRELLLRPVVTGSDDRSQVIIVTRIQAQAIRPENLRIRAQDINHRDFELPLPPELVVADVPLVGDVMEGVVLRVRNRAARQVRLTVHAVVPGAGAQIESLPLDPEPFSTDGSGAGSSAYFASPGDGTRAAAPLQAAPHTVSLPTDVVSVSVAVEDAAVRFRFSTDGGFNYGSWLVLPPGLWSFPLPATDVQVARADDGDAADYQIISLSS